MPTEPYMLTAEERQPFLDLNTQAVNQQLAVYNLNVQLEKAQRERDAAGSMLAGALYHFLKAKGMEGATLTPDFTRIIPQGQKQ